MQDKIDYEKFYEDLFKTLVDGAESSKRGAVGAHVNDIINDAKKSGYLINGMEKEFLKGIPIYFEKKGIRVDISEMDLSGVTYLLDSIDNKD